MASMCYQNNIKLYRLRPKFHLGVHIVLSLRDGDQHSINPVCPWPEVVLLYMYELAC